MSTKDETLTKREIEVLYLIGQGYSSRDVAGMLSVNKRTVDFHLGNIYDKLQVNNRVKALREATRRGLIPFELTSEPVGTESIASVPTAS